MNSFQIIIYVKDMNFKSKEGYGRIGILIIHFKLRKFRIFFDKQR